MFFYLIAGALLVLNLKYIFDTISRRNPPLHHITTNAFAGATLAQIAALATAFSINMLNDSCEKADSYQPFIIGFGVISLILVVTGVVCAVKDKLTGVAFAGTGLALMYIIVAIFSSLVAGSPCLR